MTQTEASKLARELKNQGRWCHTYKKGKTWFIAQGERPPAPERKDDMLFHAFRG